jgi:hypothetical protein
MPKLNKKTNNATKIVLKSPSFKFSCLLRSNFQEKGWHAGIAVELMVNQWMLVEIRLQFNGIWCSSVSAPCLPWRGFELREASAAIAQRKQYARSKLSNDAAMLQGVDQRTGPGRRFKDIVRAVTAPVRALMPSVTITTNTQLQTGGGKPDQTTTSTQTQTAPPKGP